MANIMFSTDYDPLKKIWQGKFPAGFTVDPNISFIQLLLNELETNPDVVIQINHDTGHRMTCKEMFLKSMKIAENLTRLGIGIGDFVTIAAEHHDNLVPIVLGILATGAAVNPLHAGFSVLEFNHFIDMVKPKLIICESSITENVTKSLKTVNHSSMIYTFFQSNDFTINLVDELIHEYNTKPANFILPKLDNLGKAVAFVLCSSGTTGPPKGVLISHGMALCGLVIKGLAIEGKAMFNTSSLYWLTSITTIATSIVCHAPRVITLHPITDDLFLEILDKYQVDNIFTAPSFVAAIVKGLENGTCNLSNLRLILSGGYNLPEATIISINKLLPTANIVSIYGITDAGGGISCQTIMKKPKSIGSLVPGTVAKIINGDSFLGSNEIGEICVKKIFPLLGYLRNEEATKNGYDSDGWLHTGDLGYFDDDNDLFLIDRVKDMFKYRGFQVTPSELEEFIENKFDGIKDVVIVGIPDEKVISLPAAAVILKLNSNVTESDIFNAVKDNFSDFKQLRGGVYFVNELPKTRTGKFKRNLIRDIVVEMYAKK